MMKSQTRSRLLKVVLLGDGKVGKSSLMNRYINERFDAHSFHTIGVEFLNKEVQVNGESYTIQIWDTAGQERFKSLRTPFYRGSDCCILTFGVDDRMSFNNLTSWMKEFIDYAAVPDPSLFPFIVIGNKVDLPSRAVSHEEATSWAREHSLDYYETSAKDNVNVDLAFQSAVKQFRKMEGKMDARHRVVGETINLRAKKKESGCC